MRTLKPARNTVFKYSIDALQPLSKALLAAAR